MSLSCTMASLRRPPHSIISQPYLSFYDAPELADHVKSIDLEYSKRKLRTLGREDSLDGIVISADDIESDNGQPHGA